MIARCTIPTCDRPALCRGICGRCYQKLRRLGALNRVAPLATAPRLASADLGQIATWRARHLSWTWIADTLGRDMQSLKQSYWQARHRGRVPEIV